MKNTRMLGRGLTSYIANQGPCAVLVLTRQVRKHPGMSGLRILRPSGRAGLVLRFTATAATLSSPTTWLNFHIRPAAIKWLS